LLSFDRRKRWRHRRKHRRKRRRKERGREVMMGVLSSLMLMRRRMTIAIAMARVECFGLRLHLRLRHMLLVSFSVFKFT
jgi:hypothetical protein